MKKIFASALVLAMCAAFTACKDEVYFPDNESAEIQDNVTVTFNRDLVYPISAADEDKAGSGNQGTAVDTGDGKAYIYLFPDDDLGFTLTGLEKTNATTLEVLVNGKLVDTYTGASLTDPLKVTVDRSNFHPGRNTLTLRYTFPNGSQITHNYYYVVFSEYPTVAFSYDFTSSIAIGDSQASPSPSTMTVVYDRRDLLVDYTGRKLYLAAGNITTESTLASDAEGRYGDLWLYTMSLEATVDAKASNIDVKHIETSTLWDGTALTDIYRCTAPRSGQKDLNWEQPFDLQHHKVEHSYSCEGYLREAGESYYYTGQGSVLFTIDAKHPDSRR